MRIVLELEVDDEGLVDEKHAMGITNEAYEQLVRRIPADYSIVSIRKGD